MQSRSNRSPPPIEPVSAEFPDMRESAGNFLQFAGNLALRRIRNARQIRRLRRNSLRREAGNFSCGIWEIGDTSRENLNTRLTVCFLRVLHNRLRRDVSGQSSVFQGTRLDHRAKNFRRETDRHRCIEKFSQRGPLQELRDTIDLIVMSPGHRRELFQDNPGPVRR